MNTTSSPITQKFQSFCDTIHNADFTDKDHNHFDELMDYVMNRLCLVVGDTKYRIVEAEVYYKSKAHVDLYTHGDAEQLKQGGWYFNGMGLDITFGRRGSTEDENIYGGILIRGIKKLSDNEKYYKGPSISLKGMFSAINNVSEPEKCFYLMEHNYVKSEFNIKEPIKTKRIGLRKDDKDTKDFINRQYRYIVDITRNHVFDRRDIELRKLWKDGRISNEIVNNILDYTFKIK